MSNKNYLFKAFKNIFYNDEDDEDVDNVQIYFNSLGDNDNICHTLPVETVDYKIGQLIHIKGGDNTIYLINNIQDNNNINIVSTIDNKNSKNITQNEILNIININPDTLFIDRDYLKKIEETNPNTFNDTDKLLLKIKYYKSKIAISKIKLKIFEKEAKLVEKNNETVNISAYEELLETALEELTNIPNKETNDDEYINYIKNRFRQFYGINTINNAINLLNNALSAFGIKEVDKDKILNKYILLCDRISFVSIISIPLAYRFKIIRSCIYCFCVFVKTVISDKFVIINIILPLTTYYLYTNMDTTYLVVKNGAYFIKDILSSILCQISTLFYQEELVVVEEEEEEEDASQRSNTTETSYNALTIYSDSTFPSLTSIKSLNELYDKTVINNGNKIDNIGDIIRTQNNSVLESSQASIISSQASTISSQKSYESRPTSPLGGKIKRSRITKKHKRITIRRSKRSKKMKGGKRTRTTKKRRVVRRRKHNTKKY
uniref:Uncharacterized protein n=1 Tax=viral metagenome TaxID=1070528 RepID=A0A6C0E2X6_9ZZZZ